ncbi:MAG: hypothetical protein ABH877_04515 [bacterium]
MKPTYTTFTNEKAALERAGALTAKAAACRAQEAVHRRFFQLGRRHHEALANHCAEAARNFDRVAAFQSVAVRKG